MAIAYVLRSSVRHQNLVLAMCCSIDHSFLRVAKIVASIVITNSVAKGISGLVLKTRKNEHFDSTQAQMQYFIEHTKSSLFAGASIGVKYA